ncbi:hypothetical protein Lesp02_70690 [Lentzea sp. NBRC 105346]|uniref:hypothetical protein n=1 Tax=Lentzea sp. NBRC 105346 TaxID=3032205 RepID=UPI0024A1F188|nr:hypothetical protein [Lentzea sp. NBRC 105346]GLZ34882.1 hypothetical protein Lesp02_70690 [Lentzea sp. NBRC 105346]
MSALTDGVPPVPVPSIGRIVHYRLSEHDAEAITAARNNSEGRDRGNVVVAGQSYPATVVRTFGGHAANLQVHLDGTDTYWATSRVPGEDNGQWCWPARV